MPIVSGPSPEGQSTGGVAVPTEALVRRAQEGDRSAFDDLHRQLSGRIQRHLRVLLGPTADVDDALQSVFLEAYRNLGKFDHSSKFTTWLHGIAVRVALNASRSKRRRGRAMNNLSDQTSFRPSSVTATPEAAAVSQEQLARLHRLLASVDEGKRIAFLLYYVEQLELSELGDRLGVSPGTAWARVKRARAQVLREMEREQRVRRPRSES